MKPRASGRLAVVALLLASACGERPAAIRSEEPAQLVEDLARSLIKPCRNWLEEEDSRDESVTLGHPSSAEISTHAINFMRLVDHARGKLAPYLPPETRGVPVPPDLANVFRFLAGSLAAADANEVTAAEEMRTPNSARVRLTIAVPGLDAQSWVLSLERFEQIWRLTTAPRRG